jgi:hypothetical protein
MVKVALSRPIRTDPSEAFSSGTPGRLGKRDTVNLVYRVDGQYLGQLTAKLDGLVPIDLAKLGSVEIQDST